MPPPPSHFLEIHLNIIPHLRLGLPIGFFPSDFPTITLYTRLLSSCSYAIHDPPTLFFSIWSPRTIFVEESRLLNSSLCRVLHSLITSYLLGPNNLFNTLFSNTLSLYFSLSVSDHFSHPYKTTGEIIVLCILILIFVDSKLEEKMFCTERWQAFADFSLLFLNRIWFRLKLFPNSQLTIGYQNDVICSAVSFPVSRVTLAQLRCIASVVGAFYVRIKCVALYTITCEAYRKPFLLPLYSFVVMCSGLKDVQGKGWHFHIKLSQCFYNIIFTRLKTL